MAAIWAEGLTKHFSADIRAVDGIDLNVPSGQIFGFLGPNGSGKTTTVRMLTTLMRPTSGRAEVAGHSIVRDANAVRRSIGVALQEAGLDDLATGRELLVLQARLHEIRGDEARARATELLSIVDLSGEADRQLRTYSGGMKRRLDLAAALMHRPGIVFLDEPTTGLDPLSRAAIWRYVKELNTKEGVTFFLTTQYMEEADQLAEDLAIMNSGKIVSRGSPAQLKAQIGSDVVTVRIDGDVTHVARAEEAVRTLEGVDELRVVEDSLVLYVRDGPRAIARIVMLLGERDIAVDEVSLAHPTLDDVFLRITGHHIEENEGAREAQVTA